ncbi:MAG: DNA polymerase III subunit alpha [Planctomycetes bacterium]|nr:DNA polymerase III subunit alpha [Planctomycetota bacterium]
MARVPGFVHLHVHSHYSLLDGAITVSRLVDAAREFGMPALALTDHGNLFGCIEFYRACRDAEIKPIIGMEAYVAPRSRLEKKRSTGSAFFHFILLARDEEGYRNLIRLSSLAYTEGFYYRPRIDKEILKAHSRGLIGMSACLSSEINRAALNGTEEELRSLIEIYRDLFEPGCFFLEMQRNGLPEQERILEKIPPLAKEYGLPLVATNDIHYLRREDARAQEIHLCINTGQTMDDSDRMRFSSDQFYFRSSEEMYRNFAEFPEALENTLRIAEMCNLEIDFKKKHLPRFELPPEEEDPEAFFRRLCEEGCRERYPDFDAREDLRRRLEHEIAVIVQTGYVSYFLIVWDFIRYARNSGIPVGPGRGSAAGSVVAYALRITDIDPLKYDLLFERFLNADRVSMPDIDIDFCMEGRESVIDYVRRKYGADRVCQIATFGTMAARAVIRDVGRVLNVPLSEVDAITKKIPAGPKVKLRESLEKDGDLQKLSREDARIAELFDLALRLEGLNRHCSRHAAGVVIGDQPLIDTVPLCLVGEDIASQWTMEDLEHVGMLKMDFLGLRTLTVIDRCIREIEKSCGLRVDISAVPLDDPRTYDLLCRADTVAVFQLESKGMRDILRRMKPDRFEDLIAILALYRPGPIEGGMIDKYVARKHREEPIEYDHPVLEPILEETNGVILYQEQVMRIANQLAGFTLNEADSLRKAMGKKLPAIMAEYKEKFVGGAVAQGHDRSKAAHIFDLIEFFAGYGFNKSHSAAYALISYQTAYLKANHPTEFMAAVMTCEMSSTDKIVECLEECRHLEIEVRPPHVNHSERGFSVAEGKIWYGLAAVKGLGGKVADSIVKARAAEGPYRSLFDFCSRVDGQAVNKATLESLVFCGAFDCFGQHRSQLAASIESAIARGSDDRRDRRAGQKTLFDYIDEKNREASGEADSGRAGLDETYPDIPEWNDAELLSREKRSLGFYLSGHPLAPLLPLVRKITKHELDAVQKLPAGTDLTVGVQVAKITKKVSKRSGDLFWILLVEDLKGSQEIFVNRELYDECSDCIREEELVLLRGKIKYTDTTPSLRVFEILPLEKGVEKLTRDLSVVIPVDPPREAEDRLFRLKSVLAEHRGSCPVYIVLSGSGGSRTILQVGADLFVEPRLELIRRLGTVCGDENLHLNRMGARR